MILLAVIIKTDIKLINWTHEDEYKAKTYLVGAIILLVFQIVKYFGFHGQFQISDFNHKFDRRAPNNNESDNKLMGNY